MLEPFSIALSITIGPGAWVARSRASSAFSTEAEEVRQATVALTSLFESSRALFGEKRDALSQLAQIALDCSEPDWDGSGASPVDPMAVENASRFILALPEGLPMPEVAPEPDGAISLDWIHSRHRALSVSIGPRARVAAAWIDSPNSGQSVERFDGSTVPDLVVLKIRATLGVADAAVQAA